MAPSPCAPPALAAFAPGTPPAPAPPRASARPAPPRTPAATATATRAPAAPSRSAASTTRSAPPPALASPRSPPSAGSPGRCRMVVPAAELLLDQHPLVRGRVEVAAAAVLAGDGQAQRVAACGEGLGAEGGALVAGGGGVLVEGAAQLGAVDLEGHLPAVVVGLPQELDLVGAGGDAGEGDLDVVVGAVARELQPLAAAGGGVAGDDGGGAAGHEREGLG